MFTTTAPLSRRSLLVASAAAALSLSLSFGAAPTQPEPPARIVADQPLPADLANGVAVIKYRTQNLRILPVFGPDAAKVSPRVGHLHVTVDDSPWHWADVSGQPVVVAPLAPGPHKVLIELADANHRVLDSQAVKFDVPRR
jgi:hypothetical protein